MRARQARLAQQQLPQQTADPFAQPTVAAAAANRVKAADQAGPVATGGPSGRPHSAHEPSYSAVPRTPSR